jgi:NNP family nitrate/nitrite transporter-like MFS transporter
MLAVKDYRTWVLTIAYAACFGVEITIDNFAPIYFTDTFGASLKTAGICAGIFGMINIFARPLGGIVADKVGKIYGFSGKNLLLALLLILEGVGIIFFGLTDQLGVAIFLMFLFGMSLKMANGATYSLVPFINPKAIGSVAGIVGAGGNIGAMLIAFLFKAKAVKLTKDVIDESGVSKTKDLIDYTNAFYILGIIILITGILVLIAKFAIKDTKESPAELI